MSLLFCFVFLCLFGFFLNVQRRAVLSLPWDHVSPGLTACGGLVAQSALLQDTRGMSEVRGGNPFCFISAPAFCLRSRSKWNYFCVSVTALSHCSFDFQPLRFFPAHLQNTNGFEDLNELRKVPPCFLLCVTLSPLRPNIYRYRKHKKIYRTATIGYFPQLYSLGCYMLRL